MLTFLKSIALVFVLCAFSFKAEALHIASSTKNSEWKSNKHWIEIETSENKIYQYFLPMTELIELDESALIGEEITIQNERHLFDCVGDSLFDLSILKLSRSFIVRGKSNAPYTPLHKGKEVHAIFGSVIDSSERNFSFKIESGQNFKFFFHDKKDLDSFQNGHEFEILYEESIYEKNPLIQLGIENYGGPLYENLPLLLLGIKNLETNKEYLIKVYALYRWKPKAEDHYRIMTLSHLYHKYLLCKENPRHRYQFDAPYSPQDFLESLGTKMMVLEFIDGGYKVINLKTGKSLHGNICTWDKAFGIWDDSTFRAWP